MCYFTDKVGRLCVRNGMNGEVVWQRGGKFYVRNGKSEELQC